MIQTWAFLSERGAITNYAVGINRDCPMETKTYGHSIKDENFKSFSQKILNSIIRVTNLHRNTFLILEFSEKLRYSTKKTTTFHLLCLSVIS